MSSSIAPSQKEHMCFFLQKYVTNLIIFQIVQIHFLNYLFMVKVKVTEAINRLKMCYFLIFKILINFCDSVIMPQTLKKLGAYCFWVVRPSRFLMHAISFELCMLGF